MDFNNFEYFALMVLSGIVPITISLIHPFSPFKGKFRIVISTLIISSIPFIVWDIFATHRGHWAFNPDYLIGIKIINLPLEEYLFFMIVPFNSIFIWSLLDKYKSIKNTFKQFIKPFSKSN